ncbi:hypothetical protein N0V90_006403 [Kalmusia sp. IMI 367209]|nr:hypothetical protein N0V90_006403 [Kalmusia sp. IMI 367209]
MPPQFADVDDSAPDSSPTREPTISTAAAEQLCQSVSTLVESPAASDLRSQARIPNIQNDAAVTLEFLSHGRQSILRIGDSALQKQLQWAQSPVALTNGLSAGSVAWDLFFTLDQARALFAHHQEQVAWMHNASLIQKLYNLVQAICVLSQVAHNLDQSDLVQVLLSTATRISQSLGLNRLGPDREPLHLPEGTTVIRYLIDREVKKRTWWFLVRQDWLQIPFQNTFVIHANQFNTPMPLNCYEDEHDMIQGRKIVVQPLLTYTQTSYSNEIHKGNSREGILRLYDQTLWADTELKQKYKDMPTFFQDRHWWSLGLPEYVKQLPSIHLLSTAHKIHTIHRCFQLRSFQDKTFAYTQHSCVAISERCIKDVEKWPSNAAARIEMKMWTVITHIITCCINLTFASIFRNENILLYDGPEMQRLSRIGREAIRPAEEWSSIARRGGVLLDALFDIENSICWSDQAQFKIEDIIKRVLQVDGALQGDFSLAPEIEDLQFDFNVDWFVD